MSTPEHDMNDFSPAEWRERDALIELRRVETEVDRYREALEEVAGLERVLSVQVEELIAERDRYREALAQALATLSAKEREVERYREALERSEKSRLGYIEEVMSLREQLLAAVGGDPE